MSMVKTGLLLAAMTAIFLATGYLLGGEGGLIIAFVAALAMNGFAYWGSADMVLRMHHAREVDERTAPEFHGLVEQLAGRAGLPMPRVFVIETFRYRLSRYWIEGPRAGEWEVVAENLPGIPDGVTGRAR